MFKGKCIRKEEITVKKEQECGVERLSEREQWVLAFFVMYEEKREKLKLTETKE